MWNVLRMRAEDIHELVSPCATRTYVQVKKVSQLPTSAEHYED